MRSKLAPTLALLAAAALATTGAARALPPRPVDDRDTVSLRGNVHPLARPDLDAGPDDPERPMEKMILSLALRAGAQPELAKLIAEQHDPASPLYGQWLTPEQFADRFGPRADDVAAVTQWLASHGFTVDEVAKSRMWIDFTGRVRDVERAFHTSMRRFEVEGTLRHANSTDPAIPSALAPFVHGVVSMHDFPRKPLHHGFRTLTPQDLQPLYTSGSSHYLAPADFATIYDVNPLYAAGLTGSGQSVAIVGRTDINIGDVQYFRSYFGLPANDPQVIHNGTAPGNLGGGEESEADLDVQWAGAVAKNATIKFVVSKSTSSSDGVDLSAQYIVNNNVAPVMSTSFGSCESSMGSTERAFYNNLWSQAASQGITSFVAAGDSGASGCDPGSATSGSGRAVSGLASTPYNVAVGGTQFTDTASPSTYWNSTNDATTKGSARSYIPETAWNESGTVSGGSGLWSTGGGASSYYAKPAWQVAPGVPADGKRDMPDVALSGASHDGYIIVQGHTATASGLAAIGGTSASSPSFAGLMALVVQKTGARQGNANTRFYQLGQAQYGSGGTAVFHDTKTGNNSVPNVTGYSCGTGYDLATGLGSPDAQAMVNGWAGGTPPPPPSTYSISGTVTSNGAALSGVTVSTTGASTTTDASGRYTLSSLANGTYTVTPSRTGYTFTPVNRSVTINGANVTGQDFTGTPSSGATEKIVDGTFEGGLYGSSTSGTSGTTGPWTWTSTGGYNVISNSSTRAYQGTWLAWFNGYGRTETDTLAQKVGIASTATSAKLTFWLRITTSEPATGARDTFTVVVVDGSGVAHTLATYSNLNAASTYAQKSFDLTAYRGQTVTVKFTGTENASYGTNVYLDNVSLMVQ